ncbi:hypothetical protein CHU98_g7226 [Xylaria longipes]|nr:hypothetical protein CHU98_g7226 [Xylaria longipes]
MSLLEMHSYLTRGGSDDGCADDLRGAVGLQLASNLVEVRGDVFKLFIVGSDDYNLYPALWFRAVGCWWHKGREDVVVSMCLIAEVQAEMLRSESLMIPICHHAGGVSASLNEIKTLDLKTVQKRQAHREPDGPETASYPPKYFPQNQIQTRTSYQTRHNKYADSQTLTVTTAQLPKRLVQMGGKGVSLTPKSTSTTTTKTPYRSLLPELGYLCRRRPHQGQSDFRKANYVPATYLDISSTIYTLLKGI